MDLYSTLCSSNLPCSLKLPVGFNNNILNRQCRLSMYISKKVCPSNLIIWVTLWRCEHAAHPSICNEDVLEYFEKSLLEVFIMYRAFVYVPSDVSSAFITDLPSYPNFSCIFLSMALFYSTYVMFRWANSLDCEPYGEFVVSIPQARHNSSLMTKILRWFSGYTYRTSRACVDAILG